jgi:hypothetical protein
LPGLNGPAGLPTQLPGPVTSGEPEAKQPAAPADTAAPKGQATQPQAAQNPQSASQNQPSQLTPEMQQAMLLKRTHFGPWETVWVGAGFLLWFTEPTPAPGPLVTTGPPSTLGALGLPTTQTLFGNNRTNFGTTPGIWVEAGAWLDDCHQWGVGLAGFLLERQGQGATFTSDATGNPLLARPIISAIPNGPKSILISTPGNPAGILPAGNPQAGSISIAQNLQFAGWELNLLRNLAHRPGWDFQVLAGFRYLDLYENLNIAQTSTFLSGPALNPPVAPGTVQEIADRFTTRNQAYLGQVGAKVEWSRGPFFVDLWGKVGLGPNHERVRNLGSTTTMLPGGQTTFAQGGVLAVPGTAALIAANPGMPVGNFGTHPTNWFVIVPEVGVTGGVDVGPHLRLSAGYSFLYINSVARPGTEVNRTVNPALIPSSNVGISPSGIGQPSVVTKQDDFWVHGVRFMIELRF